MTKFRPMNHHHHNLFFLISLLVLLATNMPAALAQDNTTTTDDEGELVGVQVDLSDMDNFTSPSMAPSLSPTYFGRITPECGNETAELASNPELTRELDALLQSYTNEFKDACPLALTTDDTCDVTFSSINSTYYTLCQEQGGQIFEHSVILQCGIAPLNVDYDLGVVPECLGASCNVTEIDVGVISNDTIASFANSLDNGGCRGKVESGASSISIMMGWMTIWAATPLLIMASTLAVSLFYY